MMREIYYSIAKVLHPDVNPNADEWSNQMLREAIEAYERRDSKKLQEIKSFTDKQEIVLFSSHIAGTSHIAGMDKLESRLAEGDRLCFFREQNNPYDSRAIVVKMTDGTKIGYIPQTDNIKLSNMMDAGKLLFGRIVSKEKVKRWHKIEIMILCMNNQP